jgi:hypothetical protein
LPIADPEALPPVLLGENFSVTVTVKPAFGPPGPDGVSLPLEVISSVSGRLVGSPSEPGITIRNPSPEIRDSVIISGRHVNTFTDKFKYTGLGQTDLTTPPIEVIGRGEMPPDKNLFNLNQDRRQSETRTYELLVNEVQGLTSIIVPVTQEVINPLEAMRSFMANYNYNKHKG